MKNIDIMDRLYGLSQELPASRHESEIKKHHKKLKELIEDPKIESDILAYVSAYEKKGFENGFAMAVHIMSNAYLC